MFKNFSLNRLLALFVGAGFLFLLIESIVEHRDILIKEPMSLIPIVFSALGFVVSALAVLQWRESRIRLLHLTLFAAFLVAGAGVYFHIGEDKDEEVTAQNAKEKEKDKPLMAPLAFAGLAAFGLLGTSRKWPADVVQKG
ncbi:MAG: hypothetical protein ABSF91_02420 [Bacteroidota bacterium]|jgi:cytochrome bd-type quinol oxidase subunit 2